jgi:hypothetical protein
MFNFSFLCQIRLILCRRVESQPTLLSRNSQNVDEVLDDVLSPGEPKSIRNSRTYVEFFFHLLGQANFV